MQQTARHHVKIPQYSAAEERFNTVSHGIGALAGLVGLVLMVLKVSSVYALVCASFFGLTIILTYTISCVYHALPADSPAKRSVRVLDHCSVHLLVFGSYVPAALLGVGGMFGPTMLALVGVATVIGLVITFVDVDRFSIPAVLCHVFCGWSFIVCIPPIYESYGFDIVALIAVGGVIYSIGAILYGLGRDYKYMHSVFHVFCLGGTLCHFLAIYLYLL